MDSFGKTRFNVVIPAFNTDPNLLQDAVQSVANAAGSADSHLEVAVTVVDDGSDSNFLNAYQQVVASAGLETRLLRLPSNSGIAAARNAGIRAGAVTDWHVFLDSDDQLTDSFFNSVEPYTHSEALFLFTDHAKFTYDFGRSIEVRRKARYFELLKKHCGTSSDPFLHFTFLIHCHVIHGSLFESVGYFNSSIEYGDEIEFHLRTTAALHASAYAHVPEVLYHYRDNPGGVCNDSSKYYQLITTIQSLLLQEANRRGIQAESCRRLGKARDGAVRYVFE